MGKIGESAFCLYIDRSPRELDWGPKPDKGWDVIYLNKKVDVKASTTKKLIWPRPKNHFLSPPEADVFVGVWAGGWYFEDDPVVTLLGWVWSWKFIREHVIAPPPSNFDPGTKYMHAEDLFAMDTLHDPLRYWEKHDFSFMTAEDWEIKL